MINIIQNREQNKLVVLIVRIHKKKKVVTATAGKYRQVWMHGEPELFTVDFMLNGTVPVVPGIHISLLSWVRRGFDSPLLAVQMGSANGF